MRNDFWNKRIPTLLGIFIITIGIGITSILVKNGVIVIGRAAGGEIPQNIRISNIQDSSFTVSYATTQSNFGSISFGRDKTMGKIALDDRDQSTGIVKPYGTHHITIKNLEPQTKYLFSIVSGQTTFQNTENSDNPFEVITGPILKTPPPSQQPMAGKIIMANGSSPSEVIVYINIQNAQVISTLVKSDGNYILPLNNLLKQDHTGFFPLSETTIIQMLVVGVSEESNIKLLANQINPVPIITLSKNYDFISSTSPVATSEASLNSTKTSFPSFSINPKENTTPQIIAPKKDEKFSDQQPQFSGSASPGAKIKIIIHSDENIQTQVVVDQNGRWTYRPDSKLSPGEHTVSIIAPDQFGILKTISQTFTVYAAGTQVNESATPSATPTLALTPTVIATASITISPTPSSTPTPTLTPIPTPTSAIINPTISPPGNSTLITGGIAAAASITLGLLLFLVTRGSKAL